MLCASCLPQARQLEAAQLGSQRGEEQLVALTTQLAAQQQEAEELQVRRCAVRTQQPGN